MSDSIPQFERPKRPLNFGIPPLQDTGEGPSNRTLQPMPLSQSWMEPQPMWSSPQPSISIHPRHIRPQTPYYPPAATVQQMHLTLRVPEGTKSHVRLEYIQNRWSEVTFYSYPASDNVPACQRGYNNLYGYDTGGLPPGWEIPRGFHLDTIQPSRPRPLPRSVDLTSPQQQPSSATEDSQNPTQIPSAATVQTTGANPNDFRERAAPAVESQPEAKQLSDKSGDNIADSAAVIVPRASFTARSVKKVLKWAGNVGPRKAMNDR